MRDNATGHLFNVDGIGQDLTVNTTDTVCNLNNGIPSGVFTQLDTVVFTFSPDSGDYLHFIVGIDNLLIPSAIFVYYNYPSFGSPILNLTELEERFPRSYAQIIGNSSIAWQTECKKSKFNFFGSHIFRQIGIRSSGLQDFQIHR